MGTNKRYSALLERAMTLIETDAEKSVRLKVLTVDNVRLLQKRQNKPIRPETVKALDAIVKKTKSQAQRNVKSAQQKIMAPNSMLKTAADINSLGFMERPEFSMKLKSYATSPEGNDTSHTKLWDITRA